MVARLLVGMLFLVGLWGVVAKRNLVKKVFGLSILNSAVVLLFVMEGSRSGTAAPIMDAGVADIVDPVPQALMLTAIVIGVCVTALALGMAFRLHRATGSFDIDTIKERLRHGPF
ncbi:MAG TPA: cation:proton antiporter subunit C [Spirochaetales bacterium]|nr:cation:proton antiporter subunit C [Spirochaetales bacterium]MBP7262813.1 cation:proton antiporter subunit C [Spirochaetia bacterium]HPE36410.1 cation:proton antiporter subunit C [Spirochaetales bacterium]